MLKLPGSLAAADSSTPHIFACLRNLVLWPSCALRSPGPPHRQQSPSVSPSVSPRTCSAECTLCAQVHTAVYSPPCTIQSLRMHRCTAAAESSTTPTQYCAMTAKGPSPAAPRTAASQVCALSHSSDLNKTTSRTAAHPRPSPCTCILTHVIHTPDSASLAYSTQSKPALCQAGTTFGLFPRLPASCTPAHLHAHASLRNLDISILTTILSQQQLCGQPLPMKHDSQ